jgi:hypothetical protein
MGDGPEARPRLFLESVLVKAGLADDDAMLQQKLGPQRAALHLSE